MYLNKTGKPNFFTAKVTTNGSLSSRRASVILIDDSDPGKELPHGSQSLSGGGGPAVVAHQQQTFPESVFNGIDDNSVNQTVRPSTVPSKAQVGATASRARTRRSSLNHTQQSARTPARVVISSGQEQKEREYFQEPLQESMRIYGSQQQENEVVFVEQNMDEEADVREVHDDLAKEQTQTLNRGDESDVDQDHHHHHHGSLSKLSVIVRDIDNADDNNLYEEQSTFVDNTQEPKLDTLVPVISSSTTSHMKNTTKHNTTHSIDKQASQDILYNFRYNSRFSENRAVKSLQTGQKQRQGSTHTLHSPVNRISQQKQNPSTDATTSSFQVTIGNNLAPSRQTEVVDVGVKEKLRASHNNLMLAKIEISRIQAEHIKLQAQYNDCFSNYVEEKKGRQQALDANVTISEKMLEQERKLKNTKYDLQRQLLLTGPDVVRYTREEHEVQMTGIASKEVEVQGYLSEIKELQRKIHVQNTDIEQQTHQLDVQEQSNRDLVVALDEKEQIEVQKSAVKLEKELLLQRNHHLTGDVQKLTQEVLEQRESRDRANEHAELALQQRDALSVQYDSLLQEHSRCTHLDSELSRTRSILSGIGSADVQEAILQTRLKRMNIENNSYGISMHDSEADAALLSVLNDEDSKDQGESRIRACICGSVETLAKYSEVLKVYSRNIRCLEKDNLALQLENTRLTEQTHAVASRAQYHKGELKRATEIIQHLEETKQTLENTVENNLSMINQLHFAKSQRETTGTETPFRKVNSGTATPTQPRFNRTANIKRVGSIGMSRAHSPKRTPQPQMHSSIQHSRTSSIGSPSDISRRSSLDLRQIRNPE